MAIRRTLIIGLIAVMVLVVGAGSVAAQSTGQSTEGGTILTGHFGETWTGSNTTQGLFVQNGGTGMGIYGYSKGLTYNKAGIVGLNAATGSGVYGRALGSGSGVYGLGATGYGVYGSGIDGGHFVGTKAGFSGVYGDHANGFGVYGNALSTSKYSGVFGVGRSGVVGTINSAGGWAVWGYTSSIDGGVGVVGGSSKNYGVLAAGLDTSIEDYIGDIYLYGTLGEILTDGEYLFEASNDDIWFDLDNNNNSAGSCFKIFNGDNSNIWYACESSGVASVGTQASIVDTASEGQRLLYSIEGTGVWMEDIGSATLVNGELVVPFDAIYAQVANLSAEYQVFVTATCDQPVLLYVSAKTATGFNVKGANLDGSPSSCAFDYRVVASRLGYEGVRTEMFTAEERPAPVEGARSGVDLTQNPQGVP